jgi:hypothetical protein
MLGSTKKLRSLLDGFFYASIAFQSQTGKFSSEMSKVIMCVYLHMYVHTHVSTNAAHTSEAGS